MVDENLVEWAEKKLENGEEEDQIRKALEKSGRDPTIVDKAKQKSSSKTVQGKESGKSLTEQLNQNNRFKTDSELDKSGKKYFENFKHFLKSNQEKFLILFLILIVVLGAGALISSGALTGASTYLTGLTDSTDNESSSQVSNPEETRSVPTVVLNEGYANPGRISISSEEQLSFVNNASYSLRVSFESGKDDFQIDAGETRKTGFDSMTYYTASPVDVEDRSGISGAVIIQ